MQLLVTKRHSAFPQLLTLSYLGKPLGIDYPNIDVTSGSYFYVCSGLDTWEHTAEIHEFELLDITKGEQW